MIKQLNPTCTTAPTATTTVIALDSTWGLMGSQAGQASGGTYLTPGPYRARWQHAVIKVIAECATADMTVADQILTDAGTAAADWETQGASGTHTITAGAAPTTWEFKPMGADWRLAITSAGSPTAVRVRIQVVLPSTDYGN